MASVVIDKSDILSVNKTLAAIDTGAPTAIRLATNDTLVALKNESARQVGDRITAKITAIKKAFSVNKMTMKDLTADITCKGDPLPLVNFKHSVTMKGVKVQVFKPGSPTLVKHAFKARMKSGHLGIFWRKDRAGGTGRWKVGKRMKLPTPLAKGQWSPLREYQLPMEERHGPRVPDVFYDDKVMDPVLANASVRFDDRLEHHTQRLLDSAR